MIRLGIDIGITGAVAVFDGGYLKTVFDLPTSEKGGKVTRELDGRALSKLIYEAVKNDPYITAWGERVNANPDFGLQTMFSLGDSYGVVRGVCGSMNIPFRPVNPATWKRHFGLYGLKMDQAQRKNASMEKARELVPYYDLSLKKYHNRAEAILIGIYGRFMEEQECASSNVRSAM